MAGSHNTRAERKLRFKKEGLGVDEPTTLSQSLTLMGRMTLRDPAVVQHAYVYYVKRRFSARETANMLGLSLDCVKEWVLSFDWDAEIANNERKQWEKLQKVKKNRGELIDVHVEKGMKTAERAALAMLERHQAAEAALLDSELTDEQRAQARTFILRPSELKTLVSILNQTNDKRRDLAGIKKDPKEHVVKVDVSHNVDMVGNVAAGLATILDRNDPLNRARIEHDARPVADIMDAEFERMEESTDE